MKCGASLTVCHGTAAPSDYEIWITLRHICLRVSIIRFIILPQTDTKNMQYDCGTVRAIVYVRLRVQVPEVGWCTVRFEECRWHPSTVWARHAVTSPAVRPRYRMADLSWPRPHLPILTAIGSFYVGSVCGRHYDILSQRVIVVCMGQIHDYIDCNVHVTSVFA